MAAGESLDLQRVEEFVDRGFRLLQLHSAGRVQFVWDSALTPVLFSVEECTVYSGDKYPDENVYASLSANLLSGSKKPALQDDIGNQELLREIATMDGFLFQSGDIYSNNYYHFLTELCGKLLSFLEWEWLLKMEN